MLNLLIVLFGVVGYLQLPVRELPDVDPPIVTITLVAVFLPIAFQTGSTGILYREFAVATAGAVVISAFVALTLTPALCARALTKPAEKHGFPYNALEWIFTFIERRYVSLLGFSLRHKFLIVLVGLGVLAGTVKLFTLLPREFLPDVVNDPVQTVLVTGVEFNPVDVSVDFQSNGGNPDSEDLVSLKK
ncbi:MAG: hypothetical protein CMO80_23475 [Verrucomicrobiales bacterium]|nr:hypothetical protein [Verrucomicrobiales bacterium]